MSSQGIDRTLFLMELGLNHRIAGSEAEALYEAMKGDRKRANARMRAQLKDGRCMIHDLSENRTYYLQPESIPEWMKESMALLSLVAPQTDVDGLGFFYGDDIFYLDIKSAIPKDVKEME